MKILMVNKFYYIKGGSETYYFALKKLYEKYGHKVIDFSMKDEKNFDSDYSEYFVDNIDYNASVGLIQKIKMAKNIIYSMEAKAKFEKIIIDEKPDVVHLHIFQHQLSPSILDVIRKYNIPTIYTAHDLKMICPNYKMMHHNCVCEKCKGGKYYNCTLNKCVKNSTIKSLVSSMEGYIHRIRKTYNTIDIVITPSKFYKDKFIEFGVEKDKIYHIPNFLIDKTPEINDIGERESYYLYFGRISEEKGIVTLINAAIATGIRLKIVGTGPLLDKMIEYVNERNGQNIEFLGFVQGQDLKDIVGNSKFVVLPSEWYENGPYSAIEALQLARPIIGADIGGIPEMIQENGHLFKSGNQKNLIEIINKMERLSYEDYSNLKNNSKRLFNNIYTEYHHYEMLKEIYSKLGMKL